MRVHRHKNVLFQAVRWETNYGHTHTHTCTRFFISSSTEFPTTYTLEESLRRFILHFKLHITSFQLILLLKKNLICSVDNVNVFFKLSAIILLIWIWIQQRRLEVTVLNTFCTFYNDHFNFPLLISCRFPLEGCTARFYAPNRFFATIYGPRSLTLSGLVKSDHVPLFRFRRLDKKRLSKRAAHLYSASDCLPRTSAAHSWISGSDRFIYLFSQMGRDLRGAPLKRATCTSPLQRHRSQILMSYNECRMNFTWIKFQ